MLSAKTQIRLRGCAGWSESSLVAQILLEVLSCAGSFMEPQREKTYLLTFAPNEDNSVCASTQSDQCLRCPHEETLHAWLSKIHQEKIPIRLCGYADWSESSQGAHVPKVRFLTWRFSCRRRYSYTRRKLCIVSSIRNRCLKPSLRFLFFCAFFVSKQRQFLRYLFFFCAACVKCKTSPYFTKVLIIFLFPL